MKCGFGICYCISQKYWPIWISVLVSYLNQNRGFCYSLTGGEGELKNRKIWQRLLWMVNFAFFFACICSNVYDFSMEWKLFQIDCSSTFSFLFLYSKFNKFKSYSNNLYQWKDYNNREIILDQQMNWALCTNQLITYHL